MFDLEATCRKLGIWEELENEQQPVAIRAIPAIPIPKNSQNSQNSRPPMLKIQNAYPGDSKSELEAAKKHFTSDVPFTDQELAEHKINGLRLREDQIFVRRKLKRMYGKERLDLVNQYFDEWQKGMDTEQVEIKKENVGRKRANTWLRLYSRGKQN